MEEGGAHRLNVNMVAVAKPSMSFLMKCSIKEPYPRYKKIILGTEFHRCCGEEVSTNMMERRLAICNEEERDEEICFERERGFGRGVHGELWNERKT